MNSNIMCLPFKWKVNSNFGTIRESGKASASELQLAEIWKMGFCKNPILRLEVLFASKFLAQKTKIVHFCESLEEGKIWDLYDLKWVSYGYFPFLPILAICHWRFLGEIFEERLQRTMIFFRKLIIIICLIIGTSVTPKFFGPFWYLSCDLQL